MAEKKTAEVSRLTLFRRAVKDPAQSAENTHFKQRYSTLQDCFAVIRPALDAAGLDLVQTFEHEPVGDGGLRTYLLTYLVATDAEPPLREKALVECRFPCELEADPQRAGSRMTYLRRYSVCLIAGITGDRDDDGQAASAGQQRAERAAAVRDQAKSRGSRPGRRGEQFWRRLWARGRELAGDHPVPHDMREEIKGRVRALLEDIGVQSTNDVPDEDWPDLVASSDAVVDEILGGAPPEAEAESRVTDALVKAAGKTQGWAMSRLGELDGDAESLASELEALAEKRASEKKAPKRPRKKAAKKAPEPEPKGEKADAKPADDKGEGGFGW